MTYIGTPQHKTPCPGGHEIYNFGRLFLGHYYNILSLSDICMGIDKKFYKEIGDRQEVLKRNNACSLYDLYGHNLAQ